MTLVYITNCRLLRVPLCGPIKFTVNKRQTGDVIDNFSEWDNGKFALLRVCD